jgi:hypothetical protein
MEDPGSDADSSVVSTHAESVDAVTNLRGPQRRYQENPRKGMKENRDLAAFEPFHREFDVARIVGCRMTRSSLVTSLRCEDQSDCGSSGRRRLQPSWINLLNSTTVLELGEIVRRLSARAR